MHIDSDKLAFALARKEIGFIDLAKVSGISRTSLSYVNCGKSCKPQTAGAIARALGVPVEEIVVREK